MNNEINFEGLILSDERFQKSSVIFREEEIWVSNYDTHGFQRNATCYKLEWLTEINFKVKSSSEPIYSNIDISFDSIYGYTSKKCFRINSSNQASFLTVLNEYNQKVKKERQKSLQQSELARKKALDMLSEITFSNEYQTTFNQICINFLCSISGRFFCDPELFAGIECMIEDANPYGREMLYSSPLIRDRLRIRQEINKRQTLISIKNIDVLRKHFYNDFDLFSKLFASKFLPKDNPNSEYLSFIILNQNAIDFFSNKWIDDFGSSFTQIESTSLDDAIRTYCYLDNIMHNEVQTLGKFIYFLMKHRKYENNSNYLDCYNVTLKKVKLFISEKELENFDKKMQKSLSKSAPTINDIDLMTGFEFENFVSLLFEKLGYKTEITKGSGDQGVDVVAEKNNSRIAIQAKCYSGKVSNKSIQEVVAGMNYYHCSKGMVVTNSIFTESARKLAATNNIILWDREMIIHKLEEIDWN